MPTSRKILIADDDKLLRDALRRHMQLSGFHVLQAAHGLDALKIFWAEPDVQLVCSDMSMGSPEQDGPAFFKNIREELVKRKGLFIGVSGGFELAGMTPIIREEKQLPGSPLRTLRKPIDFMEDLLPLIKEWEEKL